jgi:hypothetical protein
MVCLGCSHMGIVVLVLQAQWAHILGALPGSCLTQVQVPNLVLQLQMVNANLKCIRHGPFLQSHMHLMQYNMYLMPCCAALCCFTGAPQQPA